MNIIVVGCGKIGTTVLAELVSEGHNVTAIDPDPEVITEITNIYDAIGVVGNGVDCDTLQKAGVDNCRLFIAAAGSDELNMLACFLARKMGARHTVARIRNPEYNDKSLGFMKQQLNLSIALNPDYLAAQEIYNVLKLPAAEKVETFSRRNFEMVEMIVKPEFEFDGKSLIDLRRKFDEKFLICVVQRGEEVYIPDGNFIIKNGDRIGITSTLQEMYKLLRSIGTKQKHVKNVMLLGASRISYYLSRMLIAGGNEAKIIEIDKNICQELSFILPEVSVINGDGANQDLLLEEGLASTDAFISLTGMDEENILISYFAMSQNVPKVITKINRDEFNTMATHLGLDTTVSPRKIVADVIVRYARALENSIGSSMETLYKLMDGKAEAAEFTVSDEFSSTNIQLKNLKFKPNTLIAGIIRSRKIIIPSGNDVILPGDSVVVFTAGRKINALAEIME